MQEKTSKRRKKILPIYKFLIQKLNVLTEIYNDDMITQFCSLMCGAIAYAVNIKQIEIASCEEIIKQIAEIENKKISLKEKKVLIENLISFLENRTV
ncbi:MAG: hypothetical protein PHC28_05905 [Flavobacterium sp.]|uniref:hypothetical protein n=1 Tax=Flavobacterium sp. TaxID=239 RepID=UPI00262EF19A|nr:hypothetical protein [Flavobacterium sp.]MDD5150003.1 hypothetical protein [Flavobacterium sp.]